MRWTDPHSWPFPIWIWLAMIVWSGAWSLWKWRHRRVQQEWPSTSGRIETALVDDNETKILGLTLGKKQNQFLAVISYSYSVGGSSFGSKFKKEFGSAGEAEEYVRELQGKPIEVQYSPTKPNNSALTDQAIATVQEQRTPAPAQVTARRIPRWLKPLLWPLILASLVGLGLSLWVHLAAVAGKRGEDTALFIALHAGIFVVWFPAVLVAQRMVGGTSGKDFWKRALRGAPAWTLYAVYSFLGYAVVNFMYFWFKAQTRKDFSGSAMEWRMFSGHWMAFYSAAAAMLYSAVAQQEPEENLCLNGHPVDPAARFCPKCGQPISRAPTQSPLQ